MTEKQTEVLENVEMDAAEGSNEVTESSKQHDPFGRDKITVLRDKIYDLGLGHTSPKASKEADAKGRKAIDDYIEDIVAERIKKLEKQNEDADDETEDELEMMRPKRIPNSLEMIQALHAGEEYIPPKTPVLDNGVDRRMTSLEMIQAQMAKQYQ
ncbi:hypothetical protein VSK70_26505 [Bacillus sp. WOD8 KX774193]|uniref:hypothetical protein n=1 Tax=Bacillus sp. WOD8 KX774193 TaxID=3096776 RepID=UPI002DBC1CF2|nr:hypothetical protein [Bacillus sp. WOD8 KX774193]MEC3859453.1 hypothetical protein [Bacillus sp. WOD8 KX774193]